MRWFRVAAFMTMAGSVLASDASAQTAIEIRVSSRYAMAPALVRGLIRVAPHRDNRVLRVEIDSPAFFRSSDVPLEGEQAALSHAFAWPSLPPGVYALVATVFGPQGQRSRRETRFEVLGPSSRLDP
jgi:hypothetical protein